jgi:hypothetical protein
LNSGSAVIDKNGIATRINPRKLITSQIINQATITVKPSPFGNTVVLLDGFKLGEIGSDEWDFVAIHRSS